MVKYGRIPVKIIELIVMPVTVYKDGNLPKREARTS